MSAAYLCARAGSSRRHLGTFAHQAAIGVWRLAPICTTDDGGPWPPTTDTDTRPLCTRCTARLTALNTLAADVSGI